MHGCTIILSTMVFLRLLATSLVLLPLAKSVYGNSKQNNNFRLVGGATHQDGRLEVCVGEHWRPDCVFIDAQTLGKICSQLGFSDNGTIIGTSVEENSVCCNNTNATCIPCTCSKTIKLKCQAASVTQPQRPFQPTSSSEITTSTAHIPETKPHNESHQPLIAVICVLVVTLLSTAAGWIATCVVVWKKWQNIKKSLSIRGGSSQNENNTYYHTQVQESEFSEGAAHPERTFSFINSEYNIATRNQESVYDTISVTSSTHEYAVLESNDYAKVESNEHAIQTAESPAVVNGRIEEVNDEFHNAEPHIYATVNKNTKNGKVDLECS